MRSRGGKTPARNPLEGAPVNATIRALFATALLCAASPALAEDTRPYTEGEVISVSYIKTQPGRFDDYMAYLASTYQDLMEQQKQAGLITAYHVYSAAPRTPDEPDLILAIHYKNWAAFDGLSARVDAMLATKFGSNEKSNAAAIDREKLRRALGGENLQELLLK
jgi:hypothetical protein